MYKIYIKLDSNNFCTEWGTSPIDGGVSCYVESLESDYLKCIAKYRLDTDNNKLIYDETNALKNGIEYALTRYEIYDVLQKVKSVFMATFNGQTYYFKADDASRAELMNNYTLMNNGLVDSVTITCQTMLGKEIILDVTKEQLDIIVTSMVTNNNVQQKLKSATKKVIKNISSLKFLAEKMYTLGVNETKLEEVELPKEVELIIK